MEDGQSPQQVWDTADPPFPVWPENFSFGPRARTGDQLNARPEIGVSRNIPFFMKRTNGRVHMCQILRMTRSLKQIVSFKYKPQEGLVSFSRNDTVDFLGGR